MPRLFVAIALPDEVKAALAALRCGIAGARWVAPEHLHLTVRFIGEVDEAMFVSIREGLAAEGLVSFDCRLQGVGRFPPRGRPKVLWAGVQAAEGFFRLQLKVEGILRRLGVMPEERKLVPHITLARLKDAQSAPVACYLSTHGAFQSRPFVINAFHLYSSLLTAKGAIHTLEQSYAW